MVYKYIKWGFLGSSILFLLLGFYLLKPAEKIPSSNDVGQLGSLQHMKMTKRGDLHYSLAAEYASEAHLSVGAGIATTLATYYELYDVRFECEVVGWGHVKLSSQYGELDVLMKHLRLTGPVKVEFEKPPSAQAKYIDINLVTGHAKPVGMYMQVQGHELAVGSSAWQIH